MILGIVGGIAPESTIDYYRSIVALYRQRTGGRNPEIIINSIDLTKMIGFVGAGRFPELIAYLSEELKRLAAAGGELGIFASNTPHIVFDDLRRNSPIPLVSIVEETAKEARAIGVRRPGIFGTRFTMSGKFYPAEFPVVIAPRADEQELIHEKYMSELVNGTFLPATRDALLKIADRLIDEEAIDGLLLAGTELPLILTEERHRGIPLLNTTQIHVRATVERMI